MKVRYETINNDKGSSFRALHINVPTRDLKWEYHYHPEIELVCVRGGSGSRHVGYNTSNYQNGDLVLIGSNIPHSGFGLNSFDPHEEIVLQFKEEIIQFPKEVDEMQTVQKLINLAQFGILFKDEAKDIAEPMMLEILETTGSKRYLLLLELLIELSSQHTYELLNKEIMPHTIVDKNKDRLQAIFTYIENNYQSGIDINEISSQTNLTLPAFSNFFKKTMKITFTDFVNQYRIDKACAVLLQGKNISEACYNVGYNNISYFNRTFKKYMGRTPSQFINELE